LSSPILWRQFQNDYGGDLPGGEIGFFQKIRFLSYRFEIGSLEKDFKIAIAFGIDFDDDTDFDRSSSGSGLSRLSITSFFSRVVYNGLPFRNDDPPYAVESKTL
jgi:hypothetical protein